MYGPSIRSREEHAQDANADTDRDDAKRARSIYEPSRQEEVDRLMCWKGMSQTDTRRGLSGVCSTRTIQGTAAIAFEELQED